MPKNVLRADKDIVYGVYGDRLVFIPVERAKFLAQTWKAMTMAKTWGELRRLAPPDAYQQIRAFRADDEAPPESDPFDYFDATPVGDGDYPGFPAQEMMKWMPQAIWQAYAEILGTAMNGEFPHFDPGVETEVVAELRDCGFRCNRDQQLIEAAHGD